MLYNNLGKTRLRVQVDARGDTTIPFTIDPCLGHDQCGVAGDSRVDVNVHSRWVEGPRGPTTEGSRSMAQRATAENNDGLVDTTSCRMHAATAHLLAPRQRRNRGAVGQGNRAGHSGARDGAEGVNLKLLTQESVGG